MRKKQSFYINEEAEFNIFKGKKYIYWDVWQRWKSRQSMRALNFFIFSFLYLNDDDNLIAEVSPNSSPSMLIRVNKVLI